MAKRLSIALVLSILIGFGCYVILPRYGVTLPPWVPVLAFAFMVVASVAVELERDSEDDDEEQDACSCDPADRDETGDGVPDDARSVGCAGPRPVGEASRTKPAGPGCGCGR
ncbi:MAG: hypothetical protein IID31_04280 [Planctomycetes bacterium]|nr:hypothetical protein [Planctomycetota bacterium]